MNTTDKQSRLRGSSKGIEAQRAMRARGEKIATKPTLYGKSTRERDEPPARFRDAVEALDYLSALW